MEFNVLGPVTVTSGSTSVPTGGPKQRTVLSMLIARAGRPLSADALTLPVYGDVPPAKPRRAIQTYVSSLRSEIGDLIAKDGAAWTLTAARDAIDASRFEDQCESARGLEPADAAVALREALSWWRGEPYADIEAHGELDGEITRLNGLRLSALQDRIDADLATGRATELVGELDALLDQHPYQERFRRQHMLALYRAGRQSDALRSYQELRELLLDELGVDPSPELQELERQVLAQDDTALRSRDVDRPTVTPTAPTAPTAAAETSEPAWSIPAATGALLGRDEEVARIRSMLAESRLVTLTGIGGSGKTRIAMEVAELERPGFDDGTYFVDLSVVSTPEEVVSAVADAVHLAATGDGDGLPRLLQHMADTHALVVLDNCEHVIDACADLADAVLRQRGGCRLLATSRELLDIDGEQVMPIPPLSLGDDGAAVALFEARARELDPDVGYDTEARSAIAELCERLDGIALAIELAAARTNVMSPAELLDRIDDRLQTLSSGRRRRGSRRTLEATLDWSFGLLEEDEQQLLANLGVFRGFFDIAAVAAVGVLDAVTATDILDSLNAKSLVVAGRRGETTMFRLLETVRLYAEQHLEQQTVLDAVRDRHLRHYLEAVSQVASDEWVGLKPNVEAAIDWAMATDRHADAGGLFTAAGSLWHEHPMDQSTRDRFDTLIATVPPDSALRERLMLTEMQMAYAREDPDLWIEVAEVATHARDPEVRAGGLLTLANMSTIADPQKALRMVDSLDATGGDEWDPDGIGRKVRADVHMLAGAYGEGISVLQPLADSNHLVVLSLAALFLLDDRPAEALERVDAAFGRWDLENGYLARLGDGFHLVKGLSHLTLGQRDLAEASLRVLVRSASQTSVEFRPAAAITAAVGLAALVAHDGDTARASELVLHADDGALIAVLAIARMVARNVGVFDELAARQMSPTQQGRAERLAGIYAQLERWTDPAT